MSDSTTEIILLRAILRLLIVVARWMFDSKDRDYKTHDTWHAMNDGIKAAQQVIDDNSDHRA